MIKENGKSLNAVSVEAHKEAKYLAFSNIPINSILLSSKILEFLSIQIVHNNAKTMHCHKTLAILL